jgi:hypothetical protein
MDKNSREIARLAEREGVRKAKVIGGSPHCRLVGEYQGKPFSMVCTISKSKSLERNRGLVSTRANIRAIIKKLEAE